MINKISITGVFFFTLALVMGLIMIIFALGANTEDEIVDCYDNNYNKIIGERCIDEAQGKSLTKVSVIAGVVAIFIGLFVALFLQHEKSE